MAGKRAKTASHGTRTSSDQLIPPNKRVKIIAKHSTEKGPKEDIASSSPIDTETTAQPQSLEIQIPPSSKAQFAKGKNLLIPVDETCGLTGYHVFVDPSDSMIYDASLNQTNSSNNNNKFYRIQLLTNGRGDFKTWTRWCRVGATGQSKLLGGGELSDALHHFHSKFKDKTGLFWTDRAARPKPKKYVFVERSYEVDSEEEEEEKEEEEEVEDSDTATTATPASKLKRCKTLVQSTLHPSVRSLVELIFNEKYIEYTLVDMNYDAAGLPLGKLSKQTISRGYQTLKDLSELLSMPTAAVDAESVQGLSDRYYSYIPHNFGFKRPPIVNNMALLQIEVRLLDSLTDLKEAEAGSKMDKSSLDSAESELDLQFERLGLEEMVPLEAAEDEYKLIVEYLDKTSSEAHSLSYQVVDIFRIARIGESNRFITEPAGKSDRRLLWHGSRTTNFAGILGQGLRIAPPEAPCNGYMFGKGIYLADMSSKSANYCHTYSSDGHGLLLLCEAELGAPMQLMTDADYEAAERAAEAGLLSTWGQGGLGPCGWKDASCLHPSLAGVKMPDTSKDPTDTYIPDAYLAFNEYISYDVARVRLRYLIRVKIAESW